MARAKRKRKSQGRLRELAGVTSTVLLGAKRDDWARHQLKQIIGLDMRDVLREMYAVGVIESRKDASEKRARSKWRVSRANTTWGLRQQQEVAETHSWREGYLEELLKTRHVDCELADALIAELSRNRSGSFTRRFRRGFLKLTGIRVR